jgi:5-methylcytosine-specific restriction protein B
MLYPLFRFAITHDPAALGPVQVDPTTGDEEPAVVYTWEQLVDDTFLDQDFLEDVQLLMHDKKQIIFYGPPGTGKTWVGQRFAQYWVDQAEDLGGEVQIIQFHPSYAYEEFVEGIRPQSIKTQEGRQELSYPVKKGLFWRFCDLARTHPRRRYVLIIDEVNRGELPRILGELLYLLEYRRESVVLPYSGEPFGIPANMYLIGTMNTADRSIALVDHALRRRFHFIQMRPSPNTLSAYFQSIGDPAMAWTAELLDLLNRQLDRDGIEWHLHIGHSHFMRKDLDEAHIRLVWKHSVMPTLEEYFYRQPERLQSYQLGTLRAALGTA